MIPFTITPKSITVVVDNRNRQITEGSINFVKVKKVLAIYSQSDQGAVAESIAREELRSLIDIPAFIATITEGRVQINDAQVQYNGQPVHGHVAERLLTMLREGFNPRPLMRFLDRLHQNPVITAREEMLRWLEHSGLPLTPDGSFIAYKFVDQNYMDQHSHSVDNSVGAAIPRRSWDGVDTDRGATCAASGYHFCSFDYLGGGHPHVMLVQIAPEDVSSFPYDTEIAKGRCVFYKVIGEVPGTELGARMVEKKPVYGGLHSDPAAYTPAPVEDWNEENGEEEEDNSEDEGDGAAPLTYTEAPDAATVRKSNRQSWIDRLRGIEHGGRRLTPARLRTLVRKTSQREVMRLTGIPRSTLQGWLKSESKD
jgi:hypothetical protein